MCCLFVYSLSLFGVEEREGIGEDRESSDEETVGITLNECVVCLLPLSFRLEEREGIGEDLFLLFTPSLSSA